jgi:hypothetical protein
MLRCSAPAPSMMGIASSPPDALAQAQPKVEQRLEPELERVCIAQLVWCEAPAHACLRGEAAKLGAYSGT